MQKPQYPNAESYMTLKRDVLPRGVKVITNAVRPNMAYVNGNPYETYISFTIDGEYDCSAVNWRRFEDAMKYHDSAVKMLREAIHA
jgi:hypothetical protein